MESKMSQARSEYKLAKGLALEIRQGTFALFQRTGELTEGKSCIERCDAHDYGRTRLAIIEHGSRGKKWAIAPGTHQLTQGKSR